MRFELHLKSAILHCTHLIALTNVLEFFIITIAKIILSRQIYIFITKFNVIYLYITTTLYYFIEDYIIAFEQSHNLETSVLNEVHY